MLNRILIFLTKHPDIETLNKCSWLFRSYETTPETSYDIITAAHDPWIAWIGEVVWNSGVEIKCTSCALDSDCLYQGNCFNDVCYCNKGRSGTYCEFEMACPMLATEKADKLGTNMLAFLQIEFNYKFVYPVKTQALWEVLTRNGFTKIRLHR